MRKYGRRMVSFLLALILSLSLCATTWGADPDPTPPDYDPFGSLSTEVQTFLSKYIEYEKDAYYAPDGELWYFFWFYIGNGVDSAYDERLGKELCTTADSHAKLKEVLDAYDALPEADKTAFAATNFLEDEISKTVFDSGIIPDKNKSNVGNQLGSDGYYRNVYSYGHMGLSESGTITDPDKLTATNTEALTAAKTFLETYIDYSGGNIMIKNTEFSDGGYTDASLPFVGAAVDAYGELKRLDCMILDELYVTDGMRTCSFGERMYAFYDIANGEGGEGGVSEEETNAELRDAGYIAPVLGTDFTVTFPVELTKDQDYSYTYENGTLTITVKAGNIDHWAAAANNSDLSNLYAQLNFPKPDGMTHYNTITGNGTDGIWQDLIDGNVELVQAFGTAGNGQPFAAVNKQGDKLVITPNDQYSGNRMVVVWGNSESITESSKKFMVLLNVVVEETFRYTVDGSEIKDVSADRMSISYTGGNSADQWNVAKTDGSLTLSPAGGSFTNAGKFGELAITAPEAGYELTLVESSGNGPYGWIRHENAAFGAELEVFGDDPAYYGYSATYTLTWKKQGAADIREVITVKVTDGIKLDQLGSYGADGSTLNAALPSQPVAAVQVSTAPGTGMTVTYDPATGYFETSFTGTTPPV